MRAQSETQQVVSVQQQVVRGDGRRQILGGGFFSDKIDSFFRRDMLEGDAECGKAFDEGFEPAVDEEAFSVEDIGRLVGDLAVDGEGEVVFLHALEEGEEVR